MPSCVFRHCNNYTLTVKGKKNLSFHALPKEGLMREKWLKAIRIQRHEDDWIPTNYSTVCSEHFLSSDLYLTKKNNKRLKKTAVPVIKASSKISSQYVEKDSPFLKLICRACLATDVKMFALNKHGLRVAFEEITGLVSKNNNLPQSLCFECAHALTKCLQFKNKSLTADKHMKLLLQKYEELSFSNLETIDRRQNSLASRLSHILINDQEKLMSASDLKIEINFEVGNDAHVKQEIEICDENVDINNIDVTTDTDLMKSDNDSIISNDNESVNNFEDINNSSIDVLHVKKCEYTSEDDVPLEFCKDVIESNDDKTISNKVEEIPKKPVRKRIMKQLPKVAKRKKTASTEKDCYGAFFNVKVLTIAEQMEEIENRKDSTNFKHSPFKCKVCYKGFLDKLAYTNHALKHDDKSGNYVCYACKTRFKLPGALKKHFTAHHTKKFYCTRCPFITTHRQGAILHDKWHNGTTYTCQHCFETFTRFSTYMSHLRIKHPSDFVCQLCGNSFVSEKGLKLHKQLKHKYDDEKLEEGPLCEPCDIRFTSLAALQRHMSVSQKHNTGKKPRNEYLAREKVNDGVYPVTERKDKFEEPISCEQCNIQLKDSREYHLHFRKTHPDKNRTMYPAIKTPCMCEVCGRICQNISALRDHRWMHSESKAFKCDQCNKTFNLKQRLLIHMKVHSAVKPTWPCPVCGKGFSNHGNRGRHMVIHSGLKPFKCEMCGKGFKLASEKRVHVTYVHLKKPWPKRSRVRRQERKNAPSPNQPPSNSSGD